MPEAAHACTTQTARPHTLALQDFKIQNVVGSADVKFPVRLEGLAFAHNLFCSVSLWFMLKKTWECWKRPRADILGLRSTSQSYSQA